MNELWVKHGAYSLCIRLYDEPVNGGDMVGMISVSDPEREISIKLTQDDIDNIVRRLAPYATHTPC